MIKIGMVIGGRYEIVEKIGTGGMSDVYKAKDHKLNRFVAVKVLKQEFSENVNFVSKFRTEAQATAGLMHPNIVNVYDVGDEAGIYYIVMELIEGITLKKYIEKKIRLSVKEAISIAIQVSMGIEAAHNNHIIHRDIKPQNIIISKEGKVKVADFGIAKAASSNTITSNVMGSVHYTSPEQARGGFSDEKSDIYSLGVTIFEMITGRVPFTGETTVAIAIKHIQEEMPSPREFVEDIPISVEKIIIKCTKKSPDRRYQNMSSLIEDLKHSLISPDEDFVDMTDPNEIGGVTRMAEPSRVRKKSQDEEIVTLKAQKNDEYSHERATDKQKKSSKGKAQKSAGPKSGSGANGKKNPPKKSAGKKPSSKKSPKGKNYDDDDVTTPMDGIVTILAVVAAVIVGCLVLFSVAKKMGMLEATPFSFLQSEEKGESSIKAEMPDVAGTSVDRARTMLSDKGFTDVEIEYEESDEVSAGVVIEANIKSGKTIPVDTAIVLKVSAGKPGEGVAVVDVIGKTSAEATAMLEKAGFVVAKQEVVSEHVEKGCVADQTPGPNEKAPRGSTITIKISTGPDDNKIEMPNLKGMSEMDATVMLTEKGLSIGKSEEVNTDDAANIDVICGQSIEAGTWVDTGTSVDIQINVGPEEATYTFNSTVEGPQVEDPSFKSGTRTNVILSTPDGTELFRNDNVTSFPIAINVSGIKGAANGLITFQYLSSGAATTVTDPNTGEAVTQEGVATPKSIQRAVSFTKNE